SSAVMELSLLHQLNLARIIDFDVGPVLLADHHATNTDGLASVKGRWIVNSCLAEFPPAVVSDDDPQVLRVMVIRLGVQKNLPRTRAALRPLDEHFDRDRLVDAVDSFHGGHLTTPLQVISFG